MKSMLVPAALACAALACDSERGEPAVAAAQSAAEAAPACEATGSIRALPKEVRETSGLAWSRSAPHLLWTHNDAGGEPVLFALDTAGALVARVRVEGATHVDWEDMDAGPCDGGTCLYVGDTGDNDGARSSVTIYTLPEPSTDGGSARATAHPARYPDGRWDSEAFFVLPTGDVYLVTKGRRGPIALYRYPAPLRAGTTATLERVRELRPQPKSEDGRVTAASASPDGRWVAIRTYRTLWLYAADRLVGTGPVEPVAVDLAPLRESQGEAVALGDDGTVWLTSEAAKKRDAPTLSRMTCTLDASGGA